MPIFRIKCSFGAIFFRFVWHYFALTDHKKVAKKSIKRYTAMNDGCDESSCRCHCCCTLAEWARTTIKYLSKMSYLKFIVRTFDRNYAYAGPGERVQVETHKATLNCNSHSLVHNVIADTPLKPIWKVQKKALLSTANCHGERQCSRSPFTLCHLDRSAKFESSF